MTRFLDPKLASLDLKLLQIFDVVVAELNQTRAAERLGLTQPTVNAAMQKLRNAVGYELFDRGSHGVVLTPRGRILADAVRNVMLLMERVQGHGGEFEPAGAERTFHVGMRPDMAHLFSLALAPQVDTLGSISIYIVNRHADDLGVELRRGRPELVIDSDRVTAQGCRNELLFEDRIVVAARRGHPMLKDGLTQELYVTLGHVVLSRTNPSDIGHITQLIEERGVKRRMPLSVPAPYTALQVAARTDLLCTLPERFGHAASELDLEVYPLPIEYPPLPMYMIWHDRYDTDEGHRWLRDKLKAIAMTLEPYRRV